MNAPGSPESVNLESFTLDFMKVDPNEDAFDEEGEQIVDNDEILEQMTEAIPADAIGLGTFEDVVENWTSWQSNDRYYVLPWKGEDFDWALFRISWDDNWGRYGWEACARVAGVADGRAAARVMLKALVESWGYDLDDVQYAAYRSFLDQI